MFKFLSVNQLIRGIIFAVIVGFPLESLNQTLPIHTIFEVQGTVLVEKEQWTQPQPANVGLTLRSDDKLEVKANSSVKVICSNTLIWEVRPGKYNVSSGCPPGISVILLPGTNTDTLRAPGDVKTEETLARLPYLITPRNSSILTNRPLLRWNAVEGATNYIVRIDGVNWETETNQTEIDYSGDTSLQPEWRYRVTIVADNGKSSQSDAVVGFTVLDESTQQIVLEAKETISQQSLSPEEEGLILGKLYRGYKLYADGIEILEELVKQDSQSFAIYQLLGDIYLDTGLPQLAKKPYEKALELTTGTNNLSAQADIQTGLGIAYYNLGNEDEALQWLEKAKSSYTELGDSLQVEELEEIISSILGG